MRKGSAKQAEDERWSNDHRLAVEKAMRAGSNYGIRDTGLRARCQVPGAKCQGPDARYGKRDTGYGARDAPLALGLRKR